MDRAEANIEAAAPARPLSLNGRVLLIGQATLQQMATIGALARKRAKESARKDTPLGRVVDDPAFVRLSAAAQMECAREATKVQAGKAAGLTNEDVAEEMLAPDVLAFMLWVLARPEQPDLTLEDVRPHVTEENAPALLVEVVEAAGLDRLGNSLGLSSSATSTRAPSSAKS